MYIELPSGPAKERMSACGCRCKWVEYIPACKASCPNIVGKKKGLIFDPMPSASTFCFLNSQGAACNNKILLLQIEYDQ